jgi:hypothetical protein
MSDKTVRFLANTEYNQPSPVDTAAAESENSPGVTSKQKASSGAAYPYLNTEKLSEWIIAAEILGKPKCKRRGRW